MYGIALAAIFAAAGMLAGAKDLGELYHSTMSMLCAWYVVAGMWMIVYRIFVVRGAIYRWMLVQRLGLILGTFFLIGAIGNVLQLVVGVVLILVGLFSQAPKSQSSS